MILKFYLLIYLIVHITIFNYSIYFFFYVIINYGINMANMLH